MTTNEHDRRQQQDRARHALDPDQFLDQAEAARKGGLAAGVLHGVRHLVRRHRDRRDRAAVVMLRRQAHGERLRIIMVAAVGALDLHLLQSGLVQEMPGKLAAGARQVGPVEAVLRQHAPHPHLRAEHDREQNEPCKSREGSAWCVRRCLAHAA